MDCINIEEYTSLYIDKELNKEKEAELFSHIEECEKCRKTFEEIKTVTEELSKMPLMDLPEDFHEELMGKIRAEKILPVKTKSKMGKWRKYSLMAAAVLVLFVVIGASGAIFTGNLRLGGMSSKEAADVAESPAASPIAENSSVSKTKSFMSSASTRGEAGYDGMEAPQEESAIEYESSETGTGYTTNTGAIEADALLADRKIIKNMYLNMEVEDFDLAINRIKLAAEGSGGYVESYNSYVYYNDESSKVSLKEGYITIRLPQEQYDGTLSSLKDLGRVINENEYTSDITSEYVDTESRMNTKKAEEARLVELLAEAKTIEDIIRIEERLGLIRSDIESYESMLKNWDKLVSFSTISVNLREVETSKITSGTNNFTTKIKNSFINSINAVISGVQSLIIFLAGISVPAVVVVIVLGILFLAVRNRRKIRKKAINEFKKDEKNRE